MTHFTEVVWSWTTISVRYACISMILKIQTAGDKPLIATRSAQYQHLCGKQQTKQSSVWRIWKQEDYKITQIFIRNHRPVWEEQLKLAGVWPTPIVRAHKRQKISENTGAIYVLRTPNTELPGLRSRTGPHTLQRKCWEWNLNEAEHSYRRGKITTKTNPHKTWQTITSNFKVSWHLKRIYKTWKKYLKQN